MGKTSVAAATGVRAAQMGYRTVVMSLDIAHSLSDIFDLKKELMDLNKGKPVKVAKNLWIQEIDILQEIESNWREIHKYVSLLLNTSGLDEILAEELAILPGMEEISLLLYINRYVQEKQYDVLILDCAPTGESLRFISIPTALEWYSKKIFTIQKTVVKYVRPIASRITDVPIPGDDYFNSIESLFTRLRGVDQILVDPQITSVRLVTNPEKIVLKETQRAFMYFCLFKMNIDAVIMNRLLPQDVTDDYFRAWHENQKHYLEQAELYFNPVPIFKVPLFQGEVLGLERLQLLSEQIYRDRNPLDRFFQEDPYQLVKESDTYRLTLKLPFIVKEDVDLNKVGDELIVKVGTLKRHILLPRSVAAADKIKAKMEGHYLHIYFKGESNGDQKK